MRPATPGHTAGATVCGGMDRAVDLNGHPRNIVLQ